MSHNLQPLKTINYRGGVVRFRIPADWVEEYEDEGGGTFYESGDDTGTLRLNVITAKRPPGENITAHSPTEILSQNAAKYGVPIQPLRHGAVMIRYEQSFKEDGQPIRLRRWEIAQALPPSHVRLVMFSYTLLPEQFEDPSFAAELQLLDREIAASELSPEVG